MQLLKEVNELGSDDLRRLVSHTLFTHSVSSSSVSSV